MDRLQQLQEALLEAEMKLGEARRLMREGVLSPVTGAAALKVLAVGEQALARAARLAAAEAPPPEPEGADLVSVCGAPVVPLCCQECTARWTCDGSEACPRMQYLTAASRG